MKKFLLIMVAFCSFQTSEAQNLKIDSVYLKQVSSIPNSTNDFNKLLPLIIATGKTDEEKLVLVYYWVYSHVTFDIDRFLKTGPLQPLSLSETLQSGKAMCYEYNEFIDETCKYLKIPGHSIEGYVKYYGFKEGNTFDHNNHIWYTAFIGGKWKMIDLLWASGTLSIKGDNYTFIKKLHAKYFLADPGDFIETHLPADPVWQFDNKPLAMVGFISKAEGIDNDQRSSFINYIDSINMMNKLKPKDVELKSAIRAYYFNPQNPNQIIIVYYNYAIDLVNNAKATKAELLKAKSYFTASKSLTSVSKDDDMRALAPVCDQAIKSIDTRLKFIKA